MDELSSVAGVTPSDHDDRLDALQQRRDRLLAETGRSTDRIDEVNVVVLMRIILAVILLLPDVATINGMKDFTEC